MGKKGKKGGEEAKPLLGRPGNRIKIGIVGLPNVGKSTLFNILSDQQVPAENYPFCTIDPSKAQVELPDSRLDYLSDVYKPKKTIAACLMVWDIAGLVKGANEGQGLGNEFLSNIAAVDAIYHVVRAFSSKKIQHVDGDVNAPRDLDTISRELRLKDITLMKSQVESRAKLVKRGNDKVLKEEYAICEKILAWLEEDKDVKMGDWSGREIEFINTINLFTAKNVVYLANVSEKNWIKGQNKWLGPIKEWVKKNSPGSPVIPFSAKFETKLHEMKSQEEKDAFLKENKSKSAISKIIKSGYKALHLVNYFTAGEPEVRAWTIRVGTKAPGAAGVIHTDFEKGFICAEVMAFDDFKEYKTTAACKSAGKYRQEGKEYVVKDGDIMLFKGNGF